MLSKPRDLTSFLARAELLLAAELEKPTGATLEQMTLDDEIARSESTIRYSLRAAHVLEDLAEKGGDSHRAISGVRVTAAQHAEELRAHARSDRAFAEEAEARLVALRAKPR